MIGMVYCWIVKIWFVLHEVYKNIKLRRYLLFKDGRLAIEQRKELVEKGPFNLIFHGVVPDWIETHELVDDDPEFMREIIMQRIRALIRDEVNYNEYFLGYLLLII